MSELDPTVLKKPELKQVEERTAPRAVVLYEAIRREGEEEIKRPTTALAWSGLAAGLSMGFSLVAEGLLQSYLPEAHWYPLVSKFGYSIGFLIVILGRQQLFTENTLTPVLPLLRKPSISTFLQVMRLWAVVLLANLVGAYIFAWVTGRTVLFEPKVHEVFALIGREAIRPGFWTLFLRAIFAGWLIALMVWLLPFAEAARVWVIIIITYVIGIAKLSHIIAGSVETLFLVVIGESSWGEFFSAFMVPTLMGNILGGVALVAIVNHGQVMAGAVKNETSS